jgi:hypothetical protein
VVIIIGAVEALNNNSVDSSIYVYNNTMNLHQGFDGYAATCIGIIARQDWSHLWFEGNNITVTLDSSRNTPDSLSYSYGAGHGIRVSADAGTEHDYKLIKNHVVVNVLGGMAPLFPGYKGYGAALAFDAVYPNVPNAVIQNNYWGSNNICAIWGFINGNGGNMILQSDTFAFTGASGTGFDRETFRLSRSTSEDRGRNIKDSIVGSSFVCTSTGTVDSIRAAVLNYPLITKCKALIYNKSDLSLAATSNEVNITGSLDYQWKKFTFSSTVNVTSGQSYILALWSESGSQRVVLGELSGQPAADTVWYHSATYGTSPNPISPIGVRYFRSIIKCYVSGASSFGESTAPGCTYVFAAPKIIDALYSGGAMDSNIVIDGTMSYPQELRLQSTLNITIQDSAASPVANAYIYAVNAYGDTIMRDTSDALGKAGKPVTYRWEANFSPSDSLLYNNFTVGAKLGPNRVDSALTVSDVLKSKTLVFGTYTPPILSTTRKLKGIKK